MSAAPSRVQRAAYRVWLAVGALVLGWVAWRLLARPVAVVIPPLLVTTGIVYLLAPVVRDLEERGLPRWLGTLLAYLGAALALTVVISVLVPMVNEQLRMFADNLPELVNKLADGLNQRLAPLDIHVPIGEAIDGDALASNIERVVGGDNLSAAAGVIGGLSGLALGVIQVAVVIIMGPVIAFYVLVDLPRIGRLVRQLIPPEHRDEAIEVAGKLHHVVGGFIRGQLLVALFVGVATSIGLAIVGLPFWLLIGVTAGVTNLVPLLGPIIAGALGVSIAMVTDGFGLAVLVLIVMVVVQQIDNHVISPLVMGRTVQVHPLAVLLTLLVAGTVYGMLGLLMAVPLVAAANVLATHFWQTRVPWARAEEADEPEEPDEPDVPPPEGDASPSVPRVPAQPRTR
jgi:predicted PurR-regulated permease PerM